MFYFDLLTNDKTRWKKIDLLILTPMKYFVFCLLLVLTFSLENCVKIDTHKVEWSISRENILFTISISKGIGGWAGFAVGPTPYGMNGINIYSAYKKDKFLGHDYYSRALFGKPILYEKPHSSNFQATTYEEGIKFSFIRPLVHNSEGFFPIRNETVKLIIAFNDFDKPEDPDEWVVHDDVRTHNLNLYTRTKEC